MTRQRKMRSYYRKWYRRLTADLSMLQIRIYDKWLRVLFYLAVLVFIMILFGIGHPPIGLAQPEPHGHLLWFLILLSMPIMPVYGLMNFLTGHYLHASLQSFFLDYQFFVLGINVFIELAVLVLLGRWTLHFRSGCDILELVRNCMWIIFFYGILCFCSFLIMLIWGHGGFLFCF